MEFIADLHIHSRYSRATAKSAELPNLYMAAAVKGIHVLATGDFTHPAWFDHLSDYLVPAEPGLFRLREDVARTCDKQIPPSCRIPVRFMLTTEISNIYKKDGRTRKNHNLVFFPDLASVKAFNDRLETIGNIHSDGRPILGLDARDLLEITLETNDQGFLVPAHIWTPWFSLLGSKSGFDSIEACFGDLSSHIFAAETGLSSDPAMNRRVSFLDNITLISNSDAHSPAKLGREVNFFDTELSYFAIKDAMETGDPAKFKGTMEFYPEEGKYHMDGHRSCGIRFTPEESRNAGGICPVCGKPLTLGVLYRVETLADRPASHKLPEKGPGFVSRIPLDEVLGELFNVGAGSKTVQSTRERLITTLGPELAILNHLPVDEIGKTGHPLLGEAISRMRENRVILSGGYDGAYGRITVFDPEERETLMGQQSLFTVAGMAVKPRKSRKKKPPETKIVPPEPRIEPLPEENPEQAAALAHTGSPLIISAGPGTGKTYTLTHKIARAVTDTGIDPARILAITFTNKAAREMEARLRTLLGDGRPLPRTTTFHAFALDLLTRDDLFRPLELVDPPDTVPLMDAAMRAAHVTSTASARDACLRQMAACRQQLIFPDAMEGIDDPDFSAVYAAYDRLLTTWNLVDFDALIPRLILKMEADPTYLRTLQNRYTHLFVDEYQDLNYCQYRLIRLMAAHTPHLTVIGDPDQAIYRFRGADEKFFTAFKTDYPDAAEIRLSRNYRSTEPILRAACGLMDKPEATLYSGIFQGPPPEWLIAPSEAAEAVAIGRRIEALMGGKDFQFSDFGEQTGLPASEDRAFADFAVLFRTHAQGERIYTALSTAGIPCQLASRAALTDLSVIRDILAHIKLSAGQVSILDQDRLARLYGKRSDAKGPLRSPDAAFFSSSAPWMQAVSGWEKLTAGDRVAAAVRLPAIAAALAASPAAAAAARQLKDLADGWGADLSAAVSALTLGLDADTVDPRAEKVSLLTLHAAKGLEFPVVFMAGCDDGYLPLTRPGKPAADIDEEKRLFYVGMTRAKERLYLTRAAKRTVYGRERETAPSPFLSAIPPDLLAAGLTEKRSGQPKRKGPQQLELFS